MTGESLRIRHIHIRNKKKTKNKSSTEFENHIRESQRSYWFLRLSITKKPTITTTKLKYTKSRSAIQRRYANKLSKFFQL